MNTTTCMVVDFQRNQKTRRDAKVFQTHAYLPMNSFTRVNPSIEKQRIYPPVSISQICGLNLSSEAILNLANAGLIVEN